ncbi:MAG: PAS domain S-box protein [Verrucomicrobiota bacterium]|nr:PAS domain S-box protein [Verrucomicrobiota bacterium]
MNFRSQSIQRKVSLVVLAVTTVAILLAAIGMLLLQQYTFHKRAETELQTVADLVAMAVNDAVIGFEPSPDDATRTLDMLRRSSEIDAAVIYTEPNLDVFAVSYNLGVVEMGPATTDFGYQWSGNGLWLVSKLQDDRGRTFARVALHSDFETLRQEQSRSILLLGTVTLIMLGVASLAAMRLNKALTKPILALHSVVKQIREQRDLTTRVPKLTNDEIGQLASGINHMLDALSEQASALLESEERYRALVMCAPAAIVVYDMEQNKFTEVNDNACRLFGMAREELLKYGPLDLSPPLQLNGARTEDFGTAMIKQALTGVMTRFEWTHRNAQGVAIPCDVALVNIASAPRRLICGILIDMSERKRAEQNLVKSQAGLEEAQSLAKLGSWEASLMPNRVEWSREMCRLHGISQNEVPTSFMQLADLVHPEDRDKLVETYQKLRQGELVDSMIYRTHPNHGPVREVRAQIVVTRNDAGQIVHVRGTCMDITELRQAEVHRLKLESQLRQAQKLDALGTLAGGIAHDFNNILSAIMGNLLLARSDTSDTATLKVCLDEIDKAGRRARDLVQRILTFSRNQEQSFKSVSLQPVVTEITQLLRSTLPAGIELNVVMPEQLPLVTADATQVHQAIMNLATNAWHAIPERVGRIHIVLETVQVDSRLIPSSPELKRGTYVRINITDEGVGMTQEVMERIFEPFFTTKPPGMGTGLGLSVVHGIMKSHGGAVTVESKLGKGTTFYLYFPVSQAQLVAQVDSAGTNGSPITLGNNQHILFIDDEESLVFLARRMLTRLGYRISGFTRADEAIAAFKENPSGIDLVVTDLSMPAQSGIEVAKQILAIKPDAAVVLASGFLREDEVKKALAVGIREVILKPNTVEQLGQVIGKILAANQKV